MKALLLLALLGGFVNVSGHSMYYECVGSGSPTVVLDAGSPDTSTTWRSVQPVIAKRTRVCAYDRAGLGRSAPASGHRTVTTQVDDLRHLLAAAHIPGPYVVVGHSWGGLLARLFASRYSRDTAGVVLLDATTFPYGGRPRINREGIDTADAAAKSAAITSLGHIPLVVLGSNKPPLDARFLRAQDAEAALSTDSVDAIARRSTHYIQRAAPEGQPGVVIAAVDAVLTAVRRHTSLPACDRIFGRTQVACR